MAKKNVNPLDFAALLESIDDNFQTVQVLDVNGKVVNEDLLPDLSDD